MKIGLITICLLPTVACFPTRAQGTAFTSRGQLQNNASGVAIAGPVTSWFYKRDTGARHVGTMAQDFHAAFQFNRADDKHINVGDEAGVTLAAIQGLNQKLEKELNRQDAENTKLKQQNDLLAERLNELEQTVKILPDTK